MGNENSEIELAFFTDAKEQLESLEMELLNLDSDSGNPDNLNKIFRAMHTLKGSAGFAGYREIESFTHNIENLMQQIRDGLIEVTDEILQLLLESKDLINMMINSRMNGTVFSDTLIIDKLCEKVTRLLNISPEKTLEKEIVHNKSSVNYYKIQLNFNENLYETGTNPLMILEDIANSFQIIESNLIVKNIPLLEHIDIYKNHMNWQLIVSGKGNMEDLNSIFLFVSIDNNIIIEKINKEEILLSEERIGEIFVKKGLLKESEIEEAMKEHTPLGEDLIKKGTVTRKMVDQAIKEQNKIRSISQLNTIRINTQKLDEIIDSVGEVVVAKSKIRAFLETKGWLNVDEEAMLEELDRHVNVLQTTVMKTRMIPIKDTFLQFRRMVRDLSHQQNKNVELKIVGEDTELDKNVIEKLKDPIKHMIRNSIDHGFESPLERASMGKTECGNLTLKAFHEGGEVIIEIIDDGRGLDKKRIFKKAISLGIAEENQELSDDEIYNFIFTPGFSTSETITDISGRGVGMDVVKSNLNSIRGNIHIFSEKNKGTTFRINIPLTLAIIDGILIKVKNSHFIIPIHSVTEFLTINENQLININKRGIAVPFRDKYISVINLCELFELGKSESKILTVIQSSNQYLGILIDEVIGKYQVVIKSLEENYQKVEYISGATLLGNGSIAMILDINALILKK